MKVSTAVNSAVDRSIEGSAVKSGHCRIAGSSRAISSRAGPPYLGIPPYYSSTATYRGPGANVVS